MFRTTIILASNLFGPSFFCTKNSLWVIILLVPTIFEHKLFGTLEFFFTKNYLWSINDPPCMFSLYPSSRTVTYFSVPAILWEFQVVYLMPGMQSLKHVPWVPNWHSKLIVKYKLELEFETKVLIWSWLMKSTL